MNKLLKSLVLLVTVLSGGCAVYEAHPVHGTAVVGYPYHTDVYYHSSSTYMTPAPVVVAPATASIMVAPSPSTMYIGPASSSVYTRSGYSGPYRVMGQGGYQGGKSKHHGKGGGKGGGKGHR